MAPTFCSSVSRLYGNQTGLLSSGFHRKVQMKELDRLLTWVAFSSEVKGGHFVILDPPTQ